MPASVNDKLRLASGSTRPVVTTLALPKAAGATTADIKSATGWNTTTGLDYVIFRRTLNTLTGKYEEQPGTRISGRATLTGTTLSAMTFDEGTEPPAGYAADDNTVVMCAPTAQWADDLVGGLLLEHTQTGAHDPAKVAMLAGAQTFTGAKTFTAATTLVNNDILPNELATNAITLDYVQITAGVTNATTTATTVGLTSTPTIPAGGRRMKITIDTQSWFNTGTAGGNITITLWEGAVGTGTALRSWISALSPSTGTPGNFVYTGIPTAGAKTYNVSIQSSATNVTANFAASTTSPAFILVEMI